MTCKCHCEMIWQQTIGMFENFACPKCDRKAFLKSDGTVYWFALEEIEEMTEESEARG